METLENPFEEPEEQPGPSGEDPFADFLNNLEEAPEMDLSTSVILRSSTGQSYPVPVEGPTSILEVCRRSGLAFGMGVEYWVNGTQMPDTELVAPGATVTVVGTVKGG